MTWEGFYWCKKKKLCWGHQKKEVWMNLCCLHLLVNPLKIILLKLCGFLHFIIKWVRRPEISVETELIVASSCRLGELSEGSQ